MAIFDGTKGAEALVGTESNDTIYGSQGSDSIDGRGGYDRLFFLLSDLNYFDAFAGSRTFTLTSDHLSDSAGLIDTSFTSIEQIRLNTTGTGDHDDVIDASAAMLAGTYAIRIWTGAGNDTISGSAGSDYIDTGAGTNVVDAGAGFDQVRAWFDGNAGPCLLSSNGSTIYATVGGVTVNTIANGEVVTIGAVGADGQTVVIDGTGLGPLSDQLVIYMDHLGADIFIGGANAEMFGNVDGAGGFGDTYTGNGGADIYDYTYAVGSMNGDTVTDFDSDDIIDLQHNTAAAGDNGSGLLADQFIGNDAFSGVAGQYRYYAEGGQTFLQVDTDGDGVGDQTLTMANGQFALGETDAGSNQLHIIGQSGTDGADFLVGTKDGEAIYAQAGNDTVAATQGADFADGGAGWDQLRFIMSNGTRFDAATGSRIYTISGDSVTDSSGVVTTSYTGFETIFINTQNTGDHGDTIDAANAGASVILRLGNGWDTVAGSAYDDDILTGLGQNWIDAGDGDDFVRAQYDNSTGETAYVMMDGDALITTVGGVVVNTVTNAETVGIIGAITTIGATIDASSLSGFGGTLILWDNDGTNISIGHDGADIFANVTGYHSGNDAYTGNGGADIYDYTWAANAMDGDHITDFDGDDIIDLQHNTIGDNGEGALADQFIGTAEFTGVAGQYRYFTFDGQTFVQADTDGDGVADQQLTIGNGQFALAETYAGSNQLQIAATRGTEDDDFFVGTKGDDHFVLYGGNDVVAATQGHDIIEGGAGTDQVRVFMYVSNRFDAYAGSRTYTISDTHIGDSSGLLDTSLSSVESIILRTNQTGDYGDTIDASAATISIAMRLGNGNDTVIGGSGDDAIETGLGINTIDAGEGYDTVYAQYDISSGATAYVSMAGNALQVSLNGVVVDSITNAELVFVQGLPTTGTTTIDASSLIGFDGTLGFWDSVGANISIGHDGADIFANLAGMNGAGDTYTGNGGADVYDYTWAVNAMNGDRITDFDADDIIDFQHNTVSDNGEGALADQFIGMGAFTGVAGQYRYYFADGETRVEADFDGDGMADATLSIEGGYFNLVETYEGSNQLRLDGQTFIGTNANDVFTGTLGNDVVTGLGGFDTLNASQGHDVFDGGPGNDRLTMMMGNAALFATAGEARTYTITNNHAGDSTGNLDTDLISVQRIWLDTRGTGDFDDTIDLTGFSSTATFASVVRTGAGNDTVYGSATADNISVGLGSNWVDAGAGVDDVSIEFANAAGGTIVVTGNGSAIQTEFNGTINTIFNAETLGIYSADNNVGARIDASGVTNFGQIGFDDNNAADTFIGHNGADFFANSWVNTVGGDTYTGNGGADIYDYTFAVSAMDGDTITDLDSDDVIDLRFNDASQNGGGFIANQFIGNDAFTGVAGQYRFDVDLDQGLTYVQVDTDGDGIADETLTITNGAFALEETAAGSNMLKLIGLSGTDGADFLVGTKDSEAIYAQDGNDTVAATQGADFADGGAGVDQLRFIMANGTRFDAATGSRIYTISGNSVTDSSGVVTTGYTGFETIFINTQNTGNYGDTIDAANASASVILRLGNGWDTVGGSAFDDDIQTGLGINTVDAGGGFDFVRAQYDNGSGETAYVTMNGSALITTVGGVVVNSVTNAEQVSIHGVNVGAGATVDASGLIGFGGTLVFWDNAGANLSIGHAGADIFANIAGMNAAGDTYTGNGGADVYDYTWAVNAMDGDHITDFDGDDIIDFQHNTIGENGQGALADQFLGMAAFSGVAGQYRYYFADGETRIEADFDGDGVADATLHINGYHNLVETAAGSNQLKEGAATVITGTAGNDNGLNALTGTMGNDIINGLGGNDTINATQGHDVIDGGAGFDTVQVVMGNASRFQQGQSEARTYVITDTSVTCNAAELQTEFSGIERVVFSLGNVGMGDTVDASTRTGTVIATLGVGDNVYLGGSGSDTVYAYLGTDTIDTGAGTDTAVVSGALGISSFLVTGGNTALVYHDGALAASIVNAETIRVGANSNAQYSDPTVYTMDASAYTGTAQIIFIDHNGADHMIGSTGGDIFANTFGNTAGGDTYTGNGGADIFDYTLAVSDMDGDTITDLDTDDVIDLRYNGAGNQGGGQLATQFIGEAAFSGVAGQYRSYTAGGHTYVQVDSNGDGVADETLTIANGEFVLGETTAGSNLLQIKPQTINGTVSDGYIAGATIFVDVDGDGQLDAGEASATTGAGGTFTLNTVNKGTLIAVGGTDSSTQFANTMVLRAPFGSTAVNPVTTLIAMVMASVGLSAAAAEAEVKDALGIDMALDLQHTDLLSAGSASALQAQKAAALISNLVLTAQAVSGAPSNVQDAILQQLSGLVAGAGMVDLTNATTLTNILNAAMPGVSGLSAVASQLSVEGAAINAATSIGAVQSAQLAALLTGDANANTLTGNNDDNVISGNGGNDTLYGMGGNDTLDGGTGADQMSGGIGDDLYIVDQAGDTVTELAGEGIDTVRSAINYTLGANVENLELSGSAVTGNGNTLDNRITGNSLANTLAGLSGNDTLLGMGGNDTLDGGVGADRMEGGAGDDRFVVNDAGDQVVELIGEGRDTVQSSINYTLGANVEDLELTASAINGTGNSLDNRITGNSQANVLSGLDGNDTLLGGNGNDTLDGGIGADRMEGGAGDDLYIIDQSGDQIVELSSQGIDTIRSAINYTLGSNVENLDLSFGSATTGTGNALDNTITGNALANTLLGDAGNDRLIGGGGDDLLRGGNGQDFMTGGTGNDRFAIDYGTQMSTKLGNLSIDSVLDFQTGDKIDLSFLDANTTKNGDQAFSWNGSTASSAAGSLWYTTYASVSAAEKALGVDIDGSNGQSPYSGPVTILFGNHDGGGADFAVALMNTSALQASNIIL